MYGLEVVVRNLRNEQGTTAMHTEKLILCVQRNIAGWNRVVAVGRSLNTTCYQSRQSIIVFLGLIRFMVHKRARSQGVPGVTLDFS